MLYLVVLNITHGLLMTNCTEPSIAYRNRLGSLLATDLTIWLSSALAGKYFCYSGRSLLPPDEPFKLANNTLNVLYSRLPKIKNVEYLRVQGEWYYTMVSSSPYARGALSALKCLNEYEDVRALYCFLVLKGYYEKLYYGRVAVVNVPCLRNVTDPGERWAIASLAKRVTGGNLTLTLNLLYSYYAYSLYYRRSDIGFTKLLLALLSTNACTPMEVDLALLCKFGSVNWHRCYTLLTFLVRSLMSPNLTR